MTNRLLEELAKATGLPENLVHRELNALLAKSGTDSSNLTLDQLREIIAEYLREVIFKMKIETAE
ncbi:MAG: hypothetical protein K2X47_12455 [Bdellovibrionales bacterium]|nr:hypothetical protein [Bdellovibrionales bacterium]